MTTVVTLSITDQSVADALEFGRAEYNRRFPKTQLPDMGAFIQYLTAQQVKQFVAQKVQSEFQDAVAKAKAGDASHLKDIADAYAAAALVPASPIGMEVTATKA